MITDLSQCDPHERLPEQPGAPDRDRGEAVRVLLQHAYCLATAHGQAGDRAARGRCADAEVLFDVRHDALHQLATEPLERRRA